MKYQGVQESIGSQIGQLEGTVLDFIANQANVALNLMQADAERNTDTSQNTGWQSQPRGNSMTASSLAEYSGIFGDLSNSQAAFAAFVSTAHSNLNANQLSELAYAIYNQYQSSEEDHA
jgi:hypothetical protein